MAIVSFGAHSFPSSRARSTTATLSSGRYDIFIGGCPGVHSEDRAARNNNTRRATEIRVVRGRTTREFASLATV